MDHLIERMEVVQDAELRVVTRPDKRDVIEHARRRGATVVEGYPATAAESVLLGARGLSHDDVVLIGFPDSIWDPLDAFVRLVAVLERHAETKAVLGLFDCAELERSDVVSADGGGRVIQVQVKPDRPRSDAVWGCAAVRAGTLAELERYSEIGHLLDDLAQHALVRCVRFDSDFVDVGTPAALARLGAR
jgi:NDP-sugar pyrophosphorylase family protein